MHVYITGSIVKNMYYHVMGKTEYGICIISSIAQQRPSTMYLLTKTQLSML